MNCKTISSKKKNYLSIVILIIFFQIQSNAQLHPTIGLNNLPADTELVCDIPWYLGSFSSSGLQNGSLVPDFKLYDLNNDSLVLSQKLSNGKPVLLIAGSLTCPVFMGKIPLINQVINLYGSQLQVYVVYVVEAHPTDTSIYFGYVNITTSNINSGILFAQPKTYGERKQMVDTMSNWGVLNAPVFIDGPCNEWWSTFGPAPNNAYLIDTNGYVSSKHAWFHKNEDNIYCDIDSLLGINSGFCNISTNGIFQVDVINNNVIGDPESILYGYANLVNNSDGDVKIFIKKLQKNIPSSWLTAFCADVCYSPLDDSVVLTIPAHETILLSLDFITGSVPDSGSVTVGFRNEKNYSNNFMLTFRASTILTSITQTDNLSTLKFYPNPVTEKISIEFSRDLDVAILNMLGQIVKTINISDFKTIIDVSDLPDGVYIIKANDDKYMITERFVKN